MTSTQTLGTKDCPRCKGTGYLPCFAFREQGRCFRCNGVGTVNPAAEKAAKAEYAARLALSAKIPSLRDLTEAAEAAGLDFMDAKDAANVYEAVVYGEIWGEDRAARFSADQVAAAVALFDGSAV